MKRAVLLILGAMLFAAGACSQKAAIAPYDSDCLWHMQQGRDYAAQGRYELAKEHYVMALASGPDPQVRRTITEKLDSIEKMIITQR